MSNKGKCKTSKLSNMSVGMPPTWRRSSYCITDNCVETTWSRCYIYISDSKEDVPSDARTVIALSEDQAQVFQDELVGEAPEGANGEIVIDRLEDGWVAFRSLSTGVTLTYDADEFSAFVAGVRAGEFRPALATA